MYGELIYNEAKDYNEVLIELEPLIEFKKMENTKTFDKLNSILEDL